MVPAQTGIMSQATSRILRIVIRSLVIILAVLGLISILSYADHYGYYRETQRMPSPRGDLDLVVLEGTGNLMGAIRDYGYEVYVVDHEARIHRVLRNGLVLKTAEGTELVDAKWDADQNVDLTISVGLVESLARIYVVPVSPFNNKVGKVRIHQTLP